MKQQLGELIQMSQHDNARGVLSAHNRFAERRLAAACSDAIARLLPAFIRLTAHLPRLPEESRYLWTNRRRRHNPLHDLAQDAVIAGQVAMLAALRTGNHEIIERTALEIQTYGAEIVAAMLAPYTIVTTGEVPLVSLGIDTNREIGEAALAITTALATRAPADFDRAVKEVAEGEAALARFGKLIRRLAAPRPMQAVR